MNHDKAKHPDQLERLFLRFRERGEARAIADVYDITAVELLSVARHLCRDAASSEDAVQATFLAAIESAGDWDSSRPLMPWLIGILTNRVRRLNSDLDQQVEVERLHLAEPQRPSDELEADELTRAVDEAIAGMPRMYQSILVLSLMHGMSPAEIANALRRPPGTVRAQLSRGLELLRNALPAVFASSLALLALPTRGLAAIKVVVLSRAEELVSPLDFGSGTALATQRTARILAASAAVVMLVAVVCMFGFDRFFGLVEQVELPAPSRSLPVSAEGSVVPFQLAIERSGRQPVGFTATGALVVELTQDQRPASSAPVRLEHLGSRSLVHVTQISDLFGEHLVLEPPHQSPVRMPIERIADPLGVCRFDELEPGYWLVHFPGRSGVVQILTDQVSSLKAALKPAVISVRGFVHDQRGQPVAYAKVWSNRRLNKTLVRELLQADAQGRFHTWLARGSVLVVRKGGLRPCSFRLNPQGSAEVDVEFELLDGGGSVRGVVCDADGEGLAQAVLQVGLEYDQWPVTIPKRTIRIRGVPSLIETDSQGQFSLEGLDPGELIVAARAPGHSSDQVVVQVRPSEAEPLRIVLGKAATIRGFVTDESGKPIPGERVRIGSKSRLHALSTVSDEAGRYELRGVDQGSVLVEVGTGAGGHARAVLDVKAGEIFDWSAVLSSGKTRIAGRVFAPGRSGERFLVVRGRGGGRKVVETDADGRFVFEIPQFELGCYATILVYRRGALVAKDPLAKRFALAHLSGLVPGDLEIKLAVPQHLVRSASVQGRIHADQHRSLGVFSLVREIPEDEVGLGEFTHEIGESIAWRCAEMPPGHYRLMMDQTLVTDFDLVAGQQLNLGLLVVPALVIGMAPSRGFGHCVLAFVPPAQPELYGTLSVEIRSGSGDLLGWRHLRRFNDGWRLSIALPRGRYRLFARDETGLQARHELRIDDLVPPSYSIVVPLARR